MNLRDLIWIKFGIRPDDILPFTASSRKGTRNMIWQVAGEIGLKVGAEIGVEWGRNAVGICRGIPDVKLYCIDPYLPYYSNFTRPSQARCDHIMECAQAKFVNYDVTFIRKKSVEASKDFENESLDFIYIDGAHNFDDVMLDLLHWVPKVKRCGLISGHDYNEGYRNGVITAVRAYTHAHNVSEYYLTSEGQKSFFWVKDW